MKVMYKTISAAVLVLFSAISLSCTKEIAQDTPKPAEGGKVFITVNGQLDEFSSDSQSRASLKSNIRVSWEGNETVYVYEGTTFRGHLNAPDEIKDDRVAQLTGTIDEPSPNAKLTLVYSNLFDSQPEVTADGKIIVNLSTQSSDDGKIPFVVYSVIEYSTVNIQNLVAKFTFATSAFTASVMGLIPDAAITKATLSGVSTECVLNLGNDSVTATGSTPGSISRTAGLGSANSMGTAFIKLAVPVSGKTSKTLAVAQGTTVTHKSDFSNKEINAGNSISTIIPLIIKYEAVDLGLNSGLRWASVNVGASNPEEYGDYYAWGETETKSSYKMKTYFDINEGNSSGYNKYYNGGSGKTVLDAEDDAASVNWGGTWRMPTDADWTELRNNCDWNWTSDYNGTGTAGMTVTGSNGNFIFLPAAGYYNDDKLNYEGSRGLYRSSSLNLDDSEGTWTVYIQSDAKGMGSNSRYQGQSVRPVSD